MTRSLYTVLANLSALLALAAAPLQAAETCVDGRCSTTFPAAFFDRYAPNNALDMIRNLPGYSLDEGNRDTRGFGGAAGNVLIDGERVSAKSDKTSDILRRIPASRVERIVLLRGQLGGLDLANQSLVANVIRREGGTSGTWRLRANQYRPDTRYYSGAAVSVSGKAFDMRYNLGLGLGEFANYSDADERVTDATGEVVETRDERFAEDGDFYNASLAVNGSTGPNVFSVNARFNHFDEAGGEASRRFPGNGEAFTVFQGDADSEDAWELGLDLQRKLSDTWNAKLIGLARGSEFKEKASLSRQAGTAPDTSLIETEFASDSRESIARIEIDFSGFAGHLFEWALEVTDNVLDSRFTLFANENGVLEPQFVPGANTEVSERRYDLSASDAFSVAGVSIDLGLGVERSRIEQSGGFSESRDFIFWKPHLLATYPLSVRTQLRFGVRREVGQLDFFDFVSSADLGDTELELGNPSLKPERTTRVEGEFATRFADLGSFSVTLFRDQISDLQDLLPLQGELEVPGNIGSGHRSGLEAELTLPLNTLGLKNGRLDAEGRWQTSSVEDPLSQRDRTHSGERDWEGSITLRQDLPETGVAWSIKAFAFDFASYFGIDEIDQRGERFDIDAKLQFRLNPAMRLELGVDNVLRDGDARDRKVFDGPRTANLLSFREQRQQNFAREFFLRLSGSF